MGYKELKLDSVVTNTECEVLKSLSIKVIYADNTAKKSQFSQGDNIAVKVVKDSKLLTYVGDVSKINAEVGQEYFMLDMSKTHQSYNEKIFPSQLRDITNLTSPSFDVEYNADGSVVIPIIDPIVNP